MDKRILSNDYVKNYIESFNYILNDVYKHSKIKLNLICDYGHNVSIRWNDFHQGHRCSECKKLKRYDINYIKEFISTFGYTCISDTYINCMSKLTIRCDKNHIFKIRFNDFQQGKRCRLCFIDSNTGEGNPNWNGDRTRKIRSGRLSFDTRNHKYLKYDLNYHNYINNKKLYNIDHIFPRIAFIDNNLDELYDKKLIREICNSIDNLKIILKKDNESKGGKYNQEEFMKWFTNKLILKLMNI